MRKEEWVRLLRQAYESPTGILVRSNDAERARQKFHRLRAQEADPFLQVLQFRVIDPKQLMIYKPTRAQADE